MRALLVLVLAAGLAAGCDRPAGPPPAVATTPAAAAACPGDAAGDP